MSSLSGTNTRKYRITGFTFQNAPANLIIWLYGPGTMSNLRIDHNVFSSFATGAIAVFLGETGSNAKFFGAIDHNTFRGANNFMAVKLFGTGDPSRWATSVRGTPENMFIEDNVMDFDSASDLGSGCIDAWSSSAVVFRYNTTRNCLVAAHGTTHGGGTVNFEAYGNTLQRLGGNSAWQNGTRLIHHQGSGEITIWGNTFKHSVSPIGGTAISVTHYRSASPSVAGYSTSLGQCSGSTARDGNASPTSTYRGWPCWMQPGRAPAGAGYGVLSPMYSWKNVDASTGNKVPLAIEDPWGSYVATHIQANRDYYDAVSVSAQTSSTSPFNGTSGVGFGTLANRPATCTNTAAPNGERGGVAYWATDQGEWNSSVSGPDGQLYECTAPNTWSLVYKPFTYPHPLQAGTQPPPQKPAPPSNVNATVTD
jgi:hypothetical protein